MELPPSQTILNMCKQRHPGRKQTYSNGPRLTELSTTSVMALTTFVVRPKSDTSQHLRREAPSHCFSVESFQPQCMN